MISVDLFQLFYEFQILLLSLNRMFLFSMEIMHIFAAIIPAVTFLYYNRFFIKKFIIILIFKLIATNLTLPNSLYCINSLLLLIKLLSYFQHAPIFLNYCCCRIFCFNIIWGYWLPIWMFFFIIKILFFFFYIMLRSKFNNILIWF